MADPIRQRTRIGDREVVAVDLFCGVGGLTYGLRQAGVDVVAGYDIDTTCRYAYEENNPGATFYDKSVTELTADDLTKHYPEGAIRVLVGCAPCQPYSAASATSKKGKTTEDREAEWEPLKAFLRLILELRPDVVSMENVTRLANPTKYPVYGDFIRQLREAGYTVEEHRPYCPDYGLPQARRRLVVVAALDGAVALIPKTHKKEDYVTAGEVLAKLPPLEHGESSAEDPLHRPRALSDINQQRITHAKVGQTWESWPIELRLPCHSRASGATYKSVYGRMDPELPSPTMTTQFFNIGTGRFIHPVKDRGLTLREGAVLQSFPQDYRFLPADRKVSFSVLGRQIGNAVPPLLGKVIGHSILNHLRQVPENRPDRQQASD
jgi:DNA (cytosine-5)-methyltransferase 1